MSRIQIVDEPKVMVMEMKEPFCQKQDLNYDPEFESKINENLIQVKTKCIYTKERPSKWGNTKDVENYEKMRI